MKTSLIFSLATKNLQACDDEDRKANALRCLEDAYILFDLARYEDACNRCITSLKYSVGVFHPDYAKAYAEFVAGE
jgi:hypothetical protein